MGFLFGSGIKLIAISDKEIKMPIALKEKESLELKIGEDKVEVYFCLPRAKEFVRYLALSLAQSGKEGMERMLEAGMELAEACLLGIREGDIILQDGEGKKPLITEPSKSGYKDNWKEIIKERMPVLLLVLGNYLVKRTRAELEVREKN